MGFDGLFFGHLDYQDLIYRGFEKKLEMVWKASANLGHFNSNLRSFISRYFIDRQSWLFTGVLPNGYGPPNSFCFDSRCNDQPIMVRYGL